MSFVAGRGYLVSGSLAGSVVIEHPLVGEGNYMGHGRNFKLYPHMQIINTSGDLVFVALDRPVAAPSGAGVQGPSAGYPRTLPKAATPGDFDYVIPTGQKLDIAIRGVSQFMTIYTIMAGNVTVSYGDQM